MIKSCIFCNEPLSEILYEGKIGNMEISFCDAHASFCDNCETITSNVSKPDTSPDAELLDKQLP